MAHFVPIPKIPSGKETAELICQHVFLLACPLDFTPNPTIRWRGRIGRWKQLFVACFVRTLPFRPVSWCGSSTCITPWQALPEACQHFSVPISRSCIGEGFLPSRSRHLSAAAARLGKGPKLPCSSLLHATQQRLTNTARPSPSTGWVSGCGRQPATYPCGWSSIRWGKGSLGLLRLRGLLTWQPQGAWAQSSSSDNEGLSPRTEETLHPPSGGLSGWICRFWGDLYLTRELINFKGDLLKPLFIKQNKKLCNRVWARHWKTLAWEMVNILTTVLKYSNITS